MDSQKKVIICVDDEAILLLALKSFLVNTYGDKYSYETAFNGKEALEIISELREEHQELFLVLTDWVMPVINGEELLNQLNEIQPSVPTVVITGLMDEPTRLSLIDSGRVEAVLTKPWDSDHLKAIIEELD